LKNLFLRVLKKEDEPLNCMGVPGDMAPFFTDLFFKLNFPHSYLLIIIARTARTLSAELVAKVHKTLKPASYMYVPLGDIGDGPLASSTL